MVAVISHNIISPLGNTSAENYAAVKQGKSEIHLYEDKWGVKEPFAASLFKEGQLEANGTLTRFETLVTESVRRALAQSDVDASSSRVVFVLSTTKGNVEMLSARELTEDEREYPGQAALRIAQSNGFTTTPIVVCNACISGLSAIALGQRLIESGDFDYAVVSGADCQGKFIVSGFQSFKALSPDTCRPFDKNRCGLNLGEAAATIVMGRGNVDDGAWHIVDCAVRNDANHISGPSRTGEGSYRALRHVLKDCPTESLAFANVHGTATLYNDEMESIALERAGLTNVPINALKGFYGHTMGAAGIMESILSMCAADDCNILPTKGYEEKGVSGNICINTTNTATTKKRFVKLMSGFGGCNAAILFGKDKNMKPCEGRVPKVSVTHRVTITHKGVTIDGKLLETTATGKPLLTEVYHRVACEYPKFYKMYCLCRLGFIASELLLRAEGKERPAVCEDRAVILFNRSSSIVADKEHQSTISDEKKFFPSPSVFVYTLPNIITGEIAIRNKYYGETSLYILPERDDNLMEKTLKASFIDKQTQSILGGWIDCPSEERFIADIFIMQKEQTP